MEEWRSARRARARLGRYNCSCGAPGGWGMGGLRVRAGWSHRVVVTVRLGIWFSKLEPRGLRIIQPVTCLTPLTITASTRR